MRLVWPLARLSTEIGRVACSNFETSCQEISAVRVRVEFVFERGAEKSGS
jgi:hypothetical protein